MPELPEVETMRRGILPVCGKTIVAAKRTRCSRKPILVSPPSSVWKKKVVGQEIQDVARIGKRVVVVLENQHHIVFEPRMTGLVLLADPPSRDHLRFEISLNSPEVPKLLYWDRRGLGSVRLFNKQEYHDKFLDGSIGIDALEITWRQMQEAFQSCRQEIKPALLDQKRIAGVGNLYASELLFAAKIDPHSRCDQLTSKQWQAIHRHMKRILLKAIQYEGSTLGDGTYRNALNQEGGYQNHHRVYDRLDQPCPRCRTAIKRIVQTQRATFFCPQCQGVAESG